VPKAFLKRLAGQPEDSRSPVRRQAFGREHAASGERRKVTCVDGAALAVRDSVSHCECGVVLWVNQATRMAAGIARMRDESTLLKIIFGSAGNENGVSCSPRTCGARLAQSGESDASALVDSSAHVSLG
jgi:hypothetical protein